jgi:hypothetical protein
MRAAAVCLCGWLFLSQGRVKTRDAMDVCERRAEREGTKGGVRLRGIGVVSILYGFCDGVFRADDMG